jgi:uncharacterized heparinase superfamily protein
VVADTNSSGLFPGGIGHRPSTVICKREASGGNVWLELSHDGYRRHFGIRHRRRLYLAQTGEDLRGEDVIDGPRPVAFQVRFHLHPDVQVSLAQSGQAAILKTAGGSGWRLRIEGGAMSLADSVYLGERGRLRRTQQILVEGRHDGGETRLRGVGGELNRLRVGAGVENRQLRAASGRGLRAARSRATCP